jgi:hypothetical protein
VQWLLVVTQAVLVLVAGSLCCMGLIWLEDTPEPHLARLTAVLLVLWFSGWW